jgi:hypothetical protein
MPRAVDTACTNRLCRHTLNSSTGACFAVQPHRTALQDTVQQPQNNNDQLGVKWPVLVPSQRTLVPRIALANKDPLKGRCAAHGNAVAGGRKVLSARPASRRVIVISTREAACCGTGSASAPVCAAGVGHVGGSVLRYWPSCRRHR